MLLYIFPKTLSIIQTIETETTVEISYLPPNTGIFVLVISPQPSAPPFLLFYPRHN